MKARLLKEYCDSITSCSSCMFEEEGECPYRDYADRVPFEDGWNFHEFQMEER